MYWQWSSNGTSFAGASYSVSYGAMKCIDVKILILYQSILFFYFSVYQFTACAYFLHSFCSFIHSPNPNVYFISFIQSFLCSFGHSSILSFIHAIHFCSFFVRLPLILFIYSFPLFLLLLSLKSHFFSWLLPKLLTIEECWKLIRSKLNTDLEKCHWSYLDLLHQISKLGS